MADYQCRAGHPLRSRYGQCSVCRDAVKRQEQDERLRERMTAMDEMTRPLGPVPRDMVIIETSTGRRIIFKCPQRPDKKRKRRR